MTIKEEVDGLRCWNCKQARAPRPECIICRGTGFQVMNIVEELVKLRKVVADLREGNVRAEKRPVANCVALAS